MCLTPLRAAVAALHALAVLPPRIRVLLQGNLPQTCALLPCMLQSLHYMRKLCSHPAFVLDMRLREHQNAAADVLGRGVVSNPKVWFGV